MPRLPTPLLVGFEEIAAQHRILLDHLDAAIAAAKADDSLTARKAVASLGDYLMAHFASEESLMAAASYPERGRHKAAHDLFMQDFAQLCRELELTGLSVPVVDWIASRVPEWVKFHIQVNDVPLGRYLASRQNRAEVEPLSSRKPRPA